MREYEDRDKDQEEQQEERPRKRGRFGEEEKKRDPIYCGSCLREIKQGDAIFEVTGAYMNLLRRKVNVCYQCAYHPPKAVTA
jgi:hypothetical protein